MATKRRFIANWLNAASGVLAAKYSKYLWLDLDAALAADDGFDIFDVEYAILEGKIRKVWPREGKYECAGPALDGRRLGIVCRVTARRKVRIITVYEDRPRQ